MWPSLKQCLSAGPRPAKRLSWREAVERVAVAPDCSQELPPSVLAAVQQAREIAQRGRHKHNFPEDLRGMCAIASCQAFSLMEKPTHRAWLAANLKHVFIVLQEGASHWYILDPTAGQFSHDFGGEPVQFPSVLVTEAEVLYAKPSERLVALCPDPEDAPAIRPLRDTPSPCHPWEIQALCTSARALVDTLDAWGWPAYQVPKFAN